MEKKRRRVPESGKKRTREKTPQKKRFTPKTIGFFTASYKPTVNGVITHISSTKKALERMGHTVYVFAPEFPGYIDKEKHIIRLPSIKNPIKRDYPLNIPFLLPLKEIKKLNLDISHTHHPFLVGRFAQKIADELGIPLVYTSHTQIEMYAEYYAPIGKDSVKRFIKSEIRRLGNVCNVVIAPTNDMKDLLKRYKVRSKIAVIENGVETDIFTPQGKENIREKMGIEKNAKVLLYVGRIEKEKNLSALLEMFLQLEEKNTHLVFVGSGKQRKMLEKMAKGEENVHFTGGIAREKLPAYYILADYFVTLSVSEVMPLTILEAMSCEIPVIGVDSIGIRGTVRHNVNGFLLRGSRKEMKKQFREILFSTPPRIRERIQKNARKTAERFSVEHTAKKLLQTYISLQT